MDNDPHRVFWCFIKDDFDAFEISAPVNASLSRLKDMVWEKGRNSTFRTTDAKNLVFWKASSEWLADGSRLTSHS